jgi:hypothetical protein
LIELSKFFGRSKKDSAFIFEEIKESDDLEHILSG